MKKYRGFWLLFVPGSLLLLGAALSGCAPDTSVPELKATVTATPPETGEVETVADASSTAGITPVEFTDTVCLDCHTNQDILKALAVEDEEPESLSSGPG
jgi:hypothetical protein